MHMYPFPIPANIATDLKQVEEIVAERMQARPVVVQAAGAYLHERGARHARAALVLLAAHLGRYDLRRVVHAATAAELIHAATVVHDALVDEAARRRDQALAGKRWSGDVALMVGDYLLALAAAEMALAPDGRIIGLYSRAVMTFCEGKLTPVAAAAPFDQAVAQYEYAAECHTAALFAAAGRVGVICGGGEDALAETLGRFGTELGMALHIAGDIRDYDTDDGRAGRSLRAGRITLPLIYAVEAGGGAELAAIVDHQPQDAPRIAAAVEQVRRQGVPPARAAARERSRRAIELLAAVPPGATRDALVALAGWAVQA